jgi:uncharacterized membrane protein YqjE
MALISQTVDIAWRLVGLLVLLVLALLVGGWWGMRMALEMLFDAGRQNKKHRP